MNIKTQSMIEIHAAVLLFGLSGLFGKFLTLPALVIVFGRTLFACLALGIMLVYSKEKLLHQSFKHIKFLIIPGIILAVHWVTFFYSIQISTVALGLLTFSTFPLFVTFAEPYFFNEKLRLFDIITAIFVIAGLALVIPCFDLGSKITQGAFWGIISGFTFAVLSLLNRKYVADYSPMIIAWYQNLIAALILFPFFLSEKIIFNLQDWILLAVLGIFCTALAHGLFIKSLMNIKTQMAGIIAGLEPVYGIFFAFLLLNEVPTLRTLAGGIIIIGTIAIATIMQFSHNR